MEKKAISRDRKVRKLILQSETLCTLTPTELQQVVAASRSPLCGTTGCTGSAECCDYT